MPPLPEAAADAVQKERQDFPLVIATIPATDRQRTMAVGVAIVLIAAAVVIAPFASIQVGQIDAFIPVLQTVVSVVDLVTATLLFAQFSIQPQRALLALASGYLFSGSFAFLQTLAFPGGYGLRRRSLEETDQQLRRAGIYVIVEAPRIEAQPCERRGCPSQ